MCFFDSFLTIPISESILVTFLRVSLSHHYERTWYPCYTHFSESMPHLFLRESLSYHVLNDPCLFLRVHFWEYPCYNFCRDYPCDTIFESIPVIPLLRVSPWHHLHTHLPGSTLQDCPLCDNSFLRDMCPGPRHSCILGGFLGLSAAHSRHTTPPPCLRGKTHSKNSEHMNVVSNEREIIIKNILWCNIIKKIKRKCVHLSSVTV